MGDAFPVYKSFYQLFLNKMNISIKLCLRGQSSRNSFFMLFSENMMSNSMSHKGLTPFSAPLASSFNWGAPCKSEVTTMGFISKIAVF